MTVEQRFLLSLDEVLGFQVECSQCHVKVVIPLIGDWRLPHGCRHCGDNWVVGENSQAHSLVFEALDELKESMKRLAGRLREVGCTFRIEIRSPEEEPEK